MSEEVKNEECSHSCDSCSQDCASREKKSFLVPLNASSSVKKVIGVASGKGGVGKSIVTAMLAVLLSRLGYKTAVLDADITGPSIPKSFGIHENALGKGDMLLPAVTKTGIKVMSINLLLESETTPVIWRGTIVSNVVKQFWTDVLWEDVDVMFIDMPPGTGDVPLTVFQSIPLDGLVVVTSPQELVSMIVAKAVNMAEAMNVKVLGLVENMSYAVCPDCGLKIEVFGPSKLDAVAKEHNLPVLGRIPIEPELALLIDQGLIETMHVGYLDDAAREITAMLK